MTLALRIGRFRQSHARLHYEAPDGVRIVMASRSGQLPRVWAHVPAGRYTPLFFSADRLQDRRRRSADPRFHSIDDALALLGREMSRPAGSTAVWAGPGFGSRAAVASWRRRLAETDPAAALRRDLRAGARVAAAPPGGEAAKTLAWQLANDEALRLWSEISHAFPAEDHLYFTGRLRTAFFNHLLPMPPGSARPIEAMLRSGHLEIIAAGEDYVLRPLPDRWGGLTLTYGDRGGRRRVLGFTDAIDATGYCTDIHRHPAPLIQSVLRAGAIQPALRPFRDVRRAAALAQVGHPGIVWRRDTAYLQTGGIHVNPATCAAVPAEASHPVPREDHRIYAMGPLLIGQFADAQSLGQAYLDARRIAGDICARWAAPAASRPVALVPAGPLQA